jgi:hypothetical protein
VLVLVVLLLSLGRVLLLVLLSSGRGDLLLMLLVLCIIPVRSLSSTIVNKIASRGVSRCVCVCVSKQGARR